MNTIKKILIGRIYTEFRRLVIISGGLGYLVAVAPLAEMVFETSADPESPPFLSSILFFDFIMIDLVI